MAKIKYQSSYSAKGYLFPALSKLFVGVPVIDFVFQKIREGLINDLNFI